MTNFKLGIYFASLMFLSVILTFNCILYIMPVDNGLSIERYALMSIICNIMFFLLMIKRIWSLTGGSNYDLSNKS